VFPEASFRGAGFLDEEIRGQVSGEQFFQGEDSYRGFLPGFSFSLFSRHSSSMPRVYTDRLRRQVSGTFQGQVSGHVSYRGFRWPAFGDRFSATGIPGADFPSGGSGGRFSEGGFTRAVLRGFGFPIGFSGGGFTVADFAGFEVSRFPEAGFLDEE